MNNKTKHIKKHTIFIEADQLLEVSLTKTKQIACKWKTDEMRWRGEIQKIYLDKDGDAYGYDVYIY